MNKVLYIILIFLINLTIISCSSSSDGDGGGSSTTTDTIAPKIFESVKVVTPTNDTTPSYTFISSDDGIIEYEGSCTSDNKTAVAGSNLIVFNTLKEGNYSDCAIRVKDSVGNRSDPLTLSQFRVDTTAPSVSSLYPANGSTSISISTGFSITFNESMDESSMSLNNQNNLCLGSVQISSDNFSTCIQMVKQPTGLENNTSFAFSASDPLTAGAVYLIKIKNAVKDAAGNSLSSDLIQASSFLVDQTLPSYITSMVEVEGGYDFTCSRKSDGTVWCWGKDEFGQLGNSGFGSDKKVARKVYGLTNAADICVGYQHACAVKSDGKMYCWGKGTDDRLGFGTTENQFSPVEVKNISNAVSCSLGTSHSCVELSDKTTRCWGNAASGQLGNGQLSTTNMTIPVSVYGISNAAQISAGGTHACAVLDNGSIACWGSGLNGELGIKLVGSKSTPVIVPVSGTFTQVSAGYGHTCALKNDGTVWCFGDNDYGQLGDNSTTDSFSAVQVNSITTAKQISTGNDFSCALLTDNYTKCWGYNSHGQLGDRSNTDRLTPVNVKLSNANNLDNVRSISSNKYTSCAVLNNNNAYCWGKGDHQQLGYTSNQYQGNRNFAVETAGSNSFIQVSNSYNFTCGIFTSGSVSCWGGNYSSSSERYGQSGTSSNSYYAYPLSGNAVENISNIAKIASGKYHHCAIDNSSKIWCWGRNNYGQQGDGISEDNYAPVEVIGISNAVEIDLGDDFSCARLSDKTVKCWGNLTQGRLGYGVGPVSAPVYNVSAAKEISMGANHSCVLNDNGTVKCWGEGGNGRLGDGYTTDRSYPVDVYNLSNASQIVTGNDFTCALRSDSNIACWGNNTDGIAGTWGELSYTPTNIPSISDVKALDAGNSHVCALLNSGGIKCWGKGDNGRLGNYNSSTMESPQSVREISSSTAIGLGENHSCAVLNNNYVVCWGWGASGQLGNNEEYSYNIPVLVRSQ